jgi:hypothetical protein
MSKASFNLNQFLTFVKTQGLSKVNRFEVLIPPPKIINNNEPARTVSLLCEVSNFPPLNLSVKPFKIFGPSYQRPITSEYGGDGISMTFHVDTDMRVKRFFDDWMENVVRKNDFTVNYQDSYATTIRIRQLDEGLLTDEAPYSTLTDEQGRPLTNLEDERNKLNIKYEIELLEAFPRSMTLMDLNNTSQNQTHRLNIIFAYRYWRRVEEKQETPIIVPDVVPFLDLPTRRGVSWNLDNNLGGIVEGSGTSDLPVAA